MLPRAISRPDEHELLLSAWRGVVGWLRNGKGVSSVKQDLLQRGQETIATGLRWLKGHWQDILQIEDLHAHYKAPYLYAVVGDPLRARHYADLIQGRYLQADGDFRTGPRYKGWKSLPISPANRYVYSNGWIIVGLRKLGLYGVAARGVDFVRRFQSPELGGFFSRFDPASGEVDPHYLDSSSTSSAGLALLACGFTEEALRAGDFILRLLDSQPEPERYYYASWQAGTGLMTDVWGDEDQIALRGRKQYCLSAEADPLKELTWLVGKPMKFLARLYDQTSERKYLDGAVWLFDFFERLGQERWHNYGSCKIMWAGAELYRHTGELRFSQAAERIFDWFCESQHPSGVWVHGLWYQRPEDQPFTDSLDIVQELCAEMIDTIFELCEDHRIKE
jgi:hypothetical protein